MSSESAFGDALGIIETISATLGSLRERLQQDGPPPVLLPQILNTLFKYTSEVKDHVGKAQTDCREHTAHAVQPAELRVQLAEKSKELTTAQSIIGELEHKVTSLKAELSSQQEVQRQEKLDHESEVARLNEEIEKLVIGNDRVTADLESTRTMRASLLAALEEEHTFEVERLKLQIGELQVRGCVSSAAQTDTEYGSKPVHLSEPVPGATEATGPERPHASASVEVICIDDDDGEIIPHDGGPVAGFKRLRAIEEQQELKKKARNVSPQHHIESSVSFSLDYSTLGSDSLTGARSHQIDADARAYASDKTSVLWKMFICAWDIGPFEKQTLLRQIDGLFSKGKEIEAAIRQIELHVVGSFNRPPPYPRCCLMASLKNNSSGNGGSTIAKTCPYCKVDSQHRLCVWASYVPGVRSAYGSRIGNVMPTGDSRQYNRDVTPWTIQVGDTTARWVLHKRRTGRSENVVNPWSVGGIPVTFDEDPLAS